MRIYLDDERVPKVEEFDFIVRSYEELKNLISNSTRKVSYISFDHDLGTDKTGLDCAKWLVFRDLYGDNTLSEDFSFNVHSANPVGRENIQKYLDGYLNTQL